MQADPQDSFSMLLKGRTSPGRVERVAFLLLLAASFLLFTLYSITTPLFEASDELWHYPFIQHLAAGGDLPVQRTGQSDEEAPWRQQGSQPPLYYLLAAQPVALLDLNWRELRRLNPHGDLGVATSDGNVNMILHPLERQEPWSGAALPVWVARMVSVILSTLTVGFSYLVAHELFPRRTSAPHQGMGLRLGTMIFTAFVPMFAFISGSVNNDNAAVLFSTIGLWWALRLVRLRDLSTGTALAAGLIVALGALSKSSALGLLGLFGFAAILATAPGHQRARFRSGIAGSIARFGLIMLAVVLLVAGWWGARNWLLYGDLLGWNAFLDVVGRRDSPASIAQLWTERESFTRAYWGIFGGMNVPMPGAIYTALNGMALLALVGVGSALLSRLARAIRERRRAAYLLSLPFRRLLLCLFWLILLFVGLLRWTTLTPASQGRLMFPAIAVIAAGMAYGLRQWHRGLLWAACAGLVLLALITPFAFIAPAYSPPASQALDETTRTLGATFGDALILEGYDNPTGTVFPGEEVTVYLHWRVTADLPVDYSVFVHLVDEHGVIVAQRDMYPGQGLLPTSELPPGYRWTDRYALQVPVLALAPRALHWAAGVYHFPTGERLPITSPGPTSKTAVEFGALALAAHPDDVAPLLSYRPGIRLTGYDVQPSTLAADAPFTVTLEWQAARDVAEDYVVSLQLFDEHGERWAQDDSMPLDGQAPTSSWDSGQRIKDDRMLHIGAGAPPGIYNLMLVLYVPDDLTRLRAFGPDGQFAGEQVLMTRLRLNP
jgi:hypothetical protein